LGEFVGIFVICCLAVTLLLATETLFDDLPDMMRNKATLGGAISYFLMLQPARLVQVMPMATLLSATYVVATLCRQNELTAVSAAGQSLPLVCLPIWLAAAGIGCLQFGVGEYVAPHLDQRATQFLSQLKDPKSVTTAPGRKHLAYRNKDSGRTWIFADFAVTGASSGVIVSSFREDGTLEEELRADTARYEGYWLFEGVTITKFDLSGQLPTGPTTFAEAVPRRDFSENPRSLQYRGQLRPPSSMTMGEIGDSLSGRADALSPATRTVLRVHWWGRVTMPFACIIAALVGVPLAVVRERRAPAWSFLAAVGLMGAYYLVSQGLMLMARGGSIPVVPAAVGPPVIAAILGGVALWRKR
jgi:lipopolysaccharide export system permease protein